MESLSESKHRAWLAGAHVIEAIKAVQRDDFDALPVHWKLAAGHDVLSSSVSGLAITARISGQIQR